MAKSKRSKRAEESPAVEQPTDHLQDSHAGGDEPEARAAGLDVDAAATAARDWRVVDAEVVDPGVLNEAAFDESVLDAAPLAVNEPVPASPGTSTALVRVEPRAPAVALAVATPRRPARPGTVLDQLVVVLATPVLLCLAALSLPGSWMRRGRRRRV